MDLCYDGFVGNCFSLFGLLSLWIGMMSQLMNKEEVKRLWMLLTMIIIIQKRKMIIIIQEMLLKKTNGTAFLESGLFIHV